jgi:hypothetical protein
MMIELMAGFDADFTIVDRDVTTGGDSLLNGKITKVWVGGKLRWSQT